jgi:hypothetical protein
MKIREKAKGMGKMGIRMADGRMGWLSSTFSSIIGLATGWILFFA